MCVLRTAEAACQCYYSDLSSEPIEGRGATGSNEPSRLGRACAPAVCARAMSPVYARQASISNLKRPESESRAAASTASGQPAVEVGDAPDGIATLALATPQRAREPGLACRARHGRTPSHRVGPGVDSDRHLTAAQVAHDAASGQCAGGSCSLSDLEGGVRAPTQPPGRGAIAPRAR
jgi:hypothetical protein